MVVGMRLVYVEIGAYLVGFLDLGFWLAIITFFFSPYGSRILGGCQWWVMCVVVSRPRILSLSLSHANTTQTRNINTPSFTSTHFSITLCHPLSLSLSLSLGSLEFNGDDKSSDYNVTAES